MVERIETMMHIKKEIHKTLSSNDVGKTGTHQAGILIPKDKDILSFFPALGNDDHNPRVRLLFLDDLASQWFFNFIYYNNKFFGGTRNEYRLTGLTSYIRQNRLDVGDEICLYLDEDNDRFISFKRPDALYTYQKGALRIHSGWKIFD
jgi:hypothetical protein